MRVERGSSAPDGKFGCFAQMDRVAALGVCEGGKGNDVVYYAYYVIYITQATPMRTLIKRGSDDTISEGDWIDPRGLGTQLFNAASPNQVVKFNAYP